MNLFRKVKSGGVNRILSSSSRCKSNCHTRRLSLLILVALLSSFSFSALAQTTVFKETFSGCNSTGGNDSKFSGSSIAAKDFTDALADNAGWTLSNGKAANNCIKLGTSSKQGSAKTPKLTNLDGDATLTFRAAAWSDDATTLTLEITGGGSLSASSVTIGNASWTDCSVNITGGTSSTQITFKGKQAKSARFFLDDVVITSAVSSTKCSTPSFSIASQSFTAGSTLSVELSCGNPENATIYYTTDGNDPTTNSQVYDGAITVSTTTTIKAMAVDPAGTLENSSVATATYTAIEQYLYKKITSTDDLEDGAAYIIVKESVSRAMTTTLSSSSTGYFSSENITKGSADNTFFSPATNEITFEKNDNGYTLKNSEGKYIGLSSSTDTKFSTTTSISTSESGKYTWTISFSSGVGNVNILDYVNQKRYIGYNESNSDFRAYASAQSIQLYKKESSTGSLSVGGENESGYYGTYYDERPFIMPANVVGYTIPAAALADGTISESSDNCYDENDVVPAKTALLLYALTSGTYTFNYTTSAAEAPTDNLLHGGDMTELGSGYKFYKLAYADANKTDLGFYYGATDGAAFTLTGTHHAFLAVPETSAAKAFVISGGHVTAIDGIEQDTTAADAPVYSLSGVRMNGGNLPKGVYIKGGKKIVKK